VLRAGLLDETPGGRGKPTDERAERFGAHWWWPWHARGAANRGVLRMATATATVREWPD